MKQEATSKRVIVHRVRKVTFTSRHKRQLTRKQLFINSCCDLIITFIIHEIFTNCPKVLNSMINNYAILIRIFFLRNKIGNIVLVLWIALQINDIIFSENSCYENVVTYNLQLNHIQCIIKPAVFGGMWNYRILVWQGTTQRAQFNQWV